MKHLKFILLLPVIAFTISNASGQGNASLNILTLNSGQVGVGSVVDIEVTVGASVGTGGQTGPIPANKIRAQISYPVALVTALPNAQQTGLPPGWTITVNNTVAGTITICNGSDVIPVGQQRVALIKVQGHTMGGPSTINGSLLFSGATCTTPGILNGDNTADNTSQTSVTVITTLPVALTELTAKLVNCRPVLHWTTGTEANSDKFEIERSKPGDAAWELIGTVAASGNTSSETEYSFTDHTAGTSADQLLYRLKMIDRDGRHKYSEILRVLVNCNTTQAYAYPNPVQDGRLYISLTGATAQTEAVLQSLSGQVVMKNKITTGTTYLNVSGVANGVYVLVIKNAAGFEKKIKVLIQK